MIRKKTATGRSRHRENVIAALLSTNTIAAASAQTGVSVPTIKRWLATCDFTAELNAARRQVMQLVINRLAGTSMNAVEVLNAVANDPRAEHSAKVASSRAILQFSIQSGLIADIDERLKVMEGTGDPNA